MSIAYPIPKDQKEPSGTATPFLVHRFTVDQYHRMIGAGIILEGARIELIEGFVVDKMTQNPPHASAVGILLKVFSSLLADNWVLRSQVPITLKTSEPEPALAIVRGPARRYFRCHPTPKDIALVIEVGDSSLLPDRAQKALVYAAARIPVYWIVNLTKNRIEVYSQPRSGKSPGYRERKDFHMTDSISLTLDDQVVGTFPVKDLLPL